MSLHKPGKEHTINFIYCWAALHPDPSRRSAPYSQRLGEACLWVQVRGRHIWHWARAFLDWEGNPKNGVGGSGPLFLLAAPQSLVPCPRSPGFSTQHFQVAEARVPEPPLHLRQENLRPPHHLPPPARQQADGGGGQDHTAQFRLASPVFALLVLS